MTPSPLDYQKAAIHYHGVWVHVLICQMHYPHMIYICFRCVTRSSPVAHTIIYLTEEITKSCVELNFGEMMVQEAT
jgi:hypothetical protein